jgi:Zn-dependent peptidase ImmA (M78 family)
MSTTFHLSREDKEKMLAPVLRSFYYDGQLDLDALCKHLKLDVFNFDFVDGQASGAIVREKGENNWKIYVRTKDGSRRKRFTVAHEVGHFLSYQNGGRSRAYIDQHGSIIDRAIMMRTDTLPKDPVVWEMEMEANELAGEMLMPEADVRSYVTEGQSIEQLADHFGVSESAVTVRLLNLGFQILEGRLPLEDSYAGDRITAV